MRRPRAAFSRARATAEPTAVPGQTAPPPDGGRTRVTYVWQADPGGSIPDVGAVRKQAGTLAIKDLAKACGTSIVGP